MQVGYNIFACIF